MGQKVNPNAIRLGIHHSWRSVWYAKKQDISSTVKMDHDIRILLRKKLKNCMVDYVGIERLMGHDKKLSHTNVTIHTSRPGAIIGRKGEGIQALIKTLKDHFSQTISCKIVQIKYPDLNAQIVADSISLQLENRVAFRRCMLKATNNAMKSGALGIKIAISGRLGGAEMARTESMKKGRIPLHTFDANVKYALSEAMTTYGVVGVKVWIFNESEVARNKVGR